MATTLGGVEVLFIDDSPEVRLIARRILEGDGATVSEAESAEAGIELPLAKLPSVIVTDLEMPGETGFDILEKWKKLPEFKNTPFLVMSGLDDRISIYRALSLGAKDYILKPFRAEVLIKKIKRAVHSAAFRVHRFAKGQMPTVSLTVAADIQMANEAGFLLETSVKLASEQDIQLDSDLLKKIGCGNLMTRTSGSSGRFTGAGRYVNEVNLIGVDEKRARKIRESLRG